MASTKANNVSRLRLKPATDMKANVPTSDTMIEMAGITIDFTSCKKT